MASDLSKSTVTGSFDMLSVVFDKVPTAKSISTNANRIRAKTVPLARTETTDTDAVARPVTKENIAKWTFPSAGTHYTTAPVMRSFYPLVATAPVALKGPAWTTIAFAQKVVHRLSKGSLMIKPRFMLSFNVRMDGQTLRNGR